MSTLSGQDPGPLQRIVRRARRLGHTPLSGSTRATLLLKIRPNALHEPRLKPFEVSLAAPCQKAVQLPTPIQRFLPVRKAASGVEPPMWEFAGPDCPQLRLNVDRVELDSRRSPLLAIQHLLAEHRRHLQERDPHRQVTTQTLGHRVRRHVPASRSHPNALACTPNVRVERAARGYDGAPQAQNLSARLRRATHNLSRTAPTHS